MQALGAYFSSAGFIPHGYCLLWRPDVLAMHVISDAVIALSYFSIPLAIVSFVRRRRDLVAEHKRVAILFSIFILGCGMTHVLGIVVLWQPMYVVDGLVKAGTAVASIVTAIALWPLLPRLLEIPSPRQLALVNAHLQDEIGARRQALTELEAIRAELEDAVQRRTAEVRSLARRFEVATAGSTITVSEQDEQLRYTWVHNAPLPAEALLGKTDEEAWGPAASANLTTLKRRVLESREPLRAEAGLPIDGVEHHFELQITPAEVNGADAGLLVAAVDVTRQKDEQQHLQLLMRELAHRSKNLLSLVEGIARLTARAEGAPSGFTSRFGGRLAALGVAYDQLITHDWLGVDMADMVGAQLAFVLPEARERIAIEGPPLVVKPEAGQYLVLALHELATNATKYGVLSDGDGRLEVNWRVGAPAEGRSAVEVVWAEVGRPLAMPERSGFGRQLLESVVPRGLGGQASLEFLPDGLCWRLLFTA